MNVFSQKYFFIYFLILLNFSSSEGQANNTYQVLARTNKIESFPCSKCHKNYKIGPVEAVGYVKDHPNMVFEHMPEVKTCSLCHDAKLPNNLNLLTGIKISLNDSSQLCGQCHGKVEYLWSLGQHGRLGGQWSGVKTQLACTACHNPHRPKFQAMTAVMPPHRSEFIIKKGEAHEP